MAAFYSVQRAATTIDAIPQIDPILNDIEEQATTGTTKTATQANVGLNGKETITSQHAANYDSLSHNIGKIAATALMSFINRKVTMVFLTRSGYK